MSIQNSEAAVTLFYTATNIHAEATEVGDYKKGNEAHAQIIKALKWLQENSLTHLLLPLLESSSIGTRSWAASYLLLHNEQKAINTLELIASSKTIHGLSAQITLREWRMGRLKIYSLKG
jgi:hypothetical protein